MEAAVPLLTNTLQKLQEFSSRQIVLGSLTAIVKAMDHKVLLCLLVLFWLCQNSAHLPPGFFRSQITPFCRVLVELLQPLWQYSENQSVLKVSIVDLATKLTEVRAHGIFERRKKRPPCFEITFT